jgi:hypothetical protein
MYNIHSPFLKINNNFYLFFSLYVRFLKNWILYAKEMRENILMYSTAEATVLQKFCIELIRQISCLWHGVLCLRGTDILSAMNVWIRRKNRYKIWLRKKNCCPKYISVSANNIINWSESRRGTIFTLGPDTAQHKVSNVQSTNSKTLFPKEKDKSNQEKCSSIK